MQRTIGIARAYGGEIIRQFGQRVHVPQAPNAVTVLAGFLRRLAVQIISARAGMRVEIAEWRIFTVQGLEQQGKHDVLEDVGKIAGVEGMAVIQGKRSLKPTPLPP